jgi:hypothetical protein
MIAWIETTIACVADFLSLIWWGLNLGRDRGGAL